MVIYTKKLHDIQYYVRAFSFRHLFDLVSKYFRVLLSDTAVYCGYH